jgi:hypothetical protein
MPDTALTLAFRKRNLPWVAFAGRGVKMNGQVDRILKDLRQKLTEADDRVEAVNARIVGWHEHAEQDVRGELALVRERIECGRAALIAAQSEIDSWTAAQKGETSGVIAIWKEQGEIDKLERRAEKAERCAVATFSAVVAALHEAEKASLEAWLARRDARSAWVGR